MHENFDVMSSKTSTCGTCVAMISDDCDAVLTFRIVESNSRLRIFLAFRTNGASTAHNRLERVVKPGNFQTSVSVNHSLEL